MGDENVPSHVNLGNRVWNNRVMAVIFPLATFVHVVLCFLSIAQGFTGSGSAAACLESHGLLPTPSGTGADGIPEECAAVGTVWQRWVCYQEHSDFGKLISFHAGPIVGTVFVIVLLCVLWILCLQKFARVLTWATLVLELLCGVALSVWLFAKVSLELGGVCLGVTLIAAVVIAVKRDAVEQCGMLLRYGAHCIQQNLSIVAVAFLLQALLLVSLTLSMAALVALMAVGEWTYQANWADSGTGECYFQPAQWANGARYFMGFMMSWTMFFCSSARLYTVGGTTAMWYWHNEHPNKIGSFLGWSFTKAAGTVAIAALLVAIFERIVRTAKDTCTNLVNCCNPLWWLLRIALCVFEEAIRAMTGFAVIIAAITGEDFFQAGKLSLHTLKGRFTSLFVVDGVAKIVLYSGGFVLAIATTLFTWIIAASVEGVDAFGPLRVLFSSGDTFLNILGVLLWFFVAFCYYVPIVGVIVLVFLSWIFEGAFGRPFTVALLIGVVANYLFTFFANTILNVVSALFVIVEIDAKNCIVPAFTELGKPGSPSEVGAYYYRLRGESDTTPEVPVVELAQASNNYYQQQRQKQQFAPPLQFVQQQGQTKQYAQPVYAQSAYAQPRYAQAVPMQHAPQPLYAQPQYAQPMNAWPQQYAEPVYAQPQYAQAPVLGAVPLAIVEPSRSVPPEYSEVAPAGSPGKQL